MKRIKRSRDRIISDSVAWTFFLASAESLAAKASAPTWVSWARPVPAMTKLPDRRLSPGFFTMASDSPVMRDSLTWSSPSRSTPSAQIWSPAPKITMSSRTSRSDRAVSSTPSRTTR